MFGFGKDWPTFDELDTLSQLDISSDCLLSLSILSVVLCLYTLWLDVADKRSDEWRRNGYVVWWPEESITDSRAVPFVCGLLMCTMRVTAFRYAPWLIKGTETNSLMNKHVWSTTKHGAKPKGVRIFRKNVSDVSVIKKIQWKWWWGLKR